MSVTVHFGARQFTLAHSGERLRDGLIVAAYLVAALPLYVAAGVLGALRRVRV